MNIQEENITRKVDDLGRIVIPKSLRSRYKINPGDELEYYTFEDDGKKYIALLGVKMKDPRFLIAADVLNELGLEIPDILLDKISEE